MLNTSFQDIIKKAKSLYRQSLYLDCIQYVDENYHRLVNQPKALSILYALQAQSYHALEQVEKAIEYYLKALENNPNDKDLYFHLGDAYLAINLNQEAIDLYNKAVLLFPDDEFFYLNLGGVYLSLGKMEKAEYCYRQMLNVNPKSAIAYRNVGNTIEYKNINNPDKEKIIHLLSQADINLQDLMQCNFALGKMYLDCKKYDHAFYYLQSGNTIRASINPFNIQNYTENIDIIINSMGKSYFDDHPFYGSDSTQPVFVIGLPRSGKTLCENIIVKHPHAKGLGEFALFEKIINIIPNLMNVNHFYLDALSQFNEINVKQLADFYLHYARSEITSEVEKIVDTTPTNFKHLGLIYLLFPRAKIIHCTRHPLDHCLQIYFKYFGQGNYYSYDLHKIAYYYLQYQRIMNHWKSILPFEILEVKYEDLILNPKSVEGKLYAYVNLSKDDIDHSKAKDDKTLVSHEIGLYKQFDKYLEVLKEILSNGGII